MTAVPGHPDRVRAFDWLRGLVIPLMIQCHAMSLLRPELRKTQLAFALSWLDGLVAPAFMLTAGFALGFVQAAPGPTPAGLRRRGLWRIAQVLAAATLVNWMWFPLFREPRWLFRVDILHCIGLSLAIVLVPVALLASRPRVLQIVALVLSAAIFAVAPFGEPVRGPWGMLANTATGAVFPLLPWTGYAFLGVALGVRRAHAGHAATLRSLGWLAVIAGALWAAGPILGGLYPPHDFKVTNPAEHARRIAILAVLLVVLLRLERASHPLVRTPVFRGIERFGRHSMLAYVFHEAILYWPILGFSFFTVWGRKTGWGLYVLLTAILIALTYGACWLQAWAMGRVRAATRPAPAQVTAPGGAGAQG